MFVALKSGLAATFCNPGVSKELCKLLPAKNINKFQAATLVRAAYRDENEVPNIKPFPYHKKEYTVWRMLLDTHKCRVHKHSKLIVIDGQVAAGKQKLAKDLAKEFDFLYLPEPTFDDLYITHWGFDARTLDSKVPKDCQSWDIERFLHNPHDRNTIVMQLYMYLMRQKLYMNALAHILCTGQGVVTIRSPWSDGVFAKAMYQSKYISPQAYEAYTDCYLASISLYLRPHLIIYLDVPVDKTLENIKNHGAPFEQNSVVLNEKYLGDIETNYKKDYLNKLSTHTPLLIYDWSQGGDTEVVVEDIENIQFESENEDSCTDPRLEDWRFLTFQWKIFIRHYTYDSDMYLAHMDIMRTDVPELLVSGNDFETWYKVWHEVPDSQYYPGYNPLKGDDKKSIMWNSDFMLGKDYVTPLMEKYYARKNKLNVKAVV